jgi:hypothetical protein
MRVEIRAHEAPSSVTTAQYITRATRVVGVVESRQGVCFHVRGHARGTPPRISCMGALSMHARRPDSFCQCMMHAHARRCNMPDDVDVSKVARHGDDGQTLTSTARNEAKSHLCRRSTVRRVPARLRSHCVSAILICIRHSDLHRGQSRQISSLPFEAMCPRCMQAPA